MNFVQSLQDRLLKSHRKMQWLLLSLALIVFALASTFFVQSIEAHVISWTWFILSLALFFWGGFLFYRSTPPAPSETPSNLEAMIPFLEPFIGNSQILGWVSGLDKECIWFSRSWLNFTGRSLEEETKAGWTAGVHGDDLDRCVREYSEAFDRRQPFRLSYRLRHHTGQYRWVVECGCPIYGHHAEFLGYVGTCMEIHQEKVKWDEWGSLAANRARLISETSREAQDPLVDIYRLLHSVSHSLSNPDTLASKSTARESVNRLKTRFREVAGLIDQMVDQSLVSTKEDDSLRLSVQPAVLSDVAGSAIKMFEPRAQKKGMQMRLKSDDALQGLFDVFRLERVFWTLLRIMIDHLPPRSEISLEIDRAGPDADWAQVRVKGISSEPAQSLQSDEEKNAVYWTKDLSLANKIVEKHAGMLEAHHSNDGTPEFKLVVPLREAA